MDKHMVLAAGIMVVIGILLSSWLPIICALIFTYFAHKAKENRNG